MFRNKVLFLVITIGSFVIYSCDENESKPDNKQEADQPIEQKDSIIISEEIVVEENLEEVEQASIINAELRGLFEETTRDIVIDSTYLSEISFGEDSSAFLTASQIIELTSVYEIEEYSYGSQWMFKELCAFDSMITEGVLENYLENLDIGMTANIHAVPLNKVELSDGSEVFLWAVEHSTFEACPYASGTEIFATVVYKGRILSCFQLGEEYGSADAPYWMDRKIYSVLDLNGNLKLTQIVSSGGETDEEGEDVVETEKETYSYSIVQGKKK